MVIAVSEKSAEGLRTVCKVTQPIIVRNPLLPDPQAQGWQRTKRPDTKPTRMTTVARLSIAKGLKYLLEAIVQVRETHPDTLFHVYGRGDMEQELLDYAAELGLNGKEIFVGPFTSRQELAEIMANTDIFVMSSVLEGQPLSVVEAMAFECPIVTTAVGGVPEIIKDGKNGLLCPPKDPTCLAEKTRLLIDDVDLRLRLGQAARASYKQGPYQPEALSTFFSDVYTKVLKKQVQTVAQDYSLSPN